jgi:esterase/lipase superfamily enzyme
MTMPPRTTKLGYLLILLLHAVGCGGAYLVDTPHLLRREDPERYYAACPEGSRTALAEVLYATDRAVDKADSTNQHYGYQRAKRLAFGEATVSLDPMPTWTQLIEDSTRAVRKQPYGLKVTSVRERGDFTPSVGQLSPDGRELSPRLEMIANLDEQRSNLHAILRERLASTPRKDVYVFVHGYNNRFDDSVFRAAEVWHYMGRCGVPFAYSWPAGMGGLRGYAYDRESGEFTVFHLKHFLQAVASCPDVERLHIIAHSRGCDVTISALRELHIGIQAQGRSTTEVLKLENLVLAAPDLDEEVFIQRFVSENMLSAAKRTTLYASNQDKAIEAADILFASRNRLGSLSGRDVAPVARKYLAKMPNVQFIECKVNSSFALSHSYVFTHPAALSDLILVLRDRRPPGALHGRPLRQPEEGIWELDQNYLLDQGAAK